MPFLLFALKRLDKRREARHEFRTFAMEKQMLHIAALELQVYGLCLCLKRRLERLEVGDFWMHCGQEQVE